MAKYEQVQTRIRATPRAWLIAGAAGFIGSHLLETGLARAVDWYVASLSPQPPILGAVPGREPEGSGSPILNMAPS
jgi:uncharacterized protein YbjT (DUF2867 family)